MAGHSLLSEPFGSQWQPGECIKGHGFKTITHGKRKERETSRRIGGCRRLSVYGLVILEINLRAKESFREKRFLICFLKLYLYSGKKLVRHVKEWKMYV